MTVVRRMLLLLAAVGTALGLSVATAGSASATYGPLAQYQVTISANCNNPDPSVCPDGLGGEWGWAVFNSDGTGDLQATFCFHLLGMGGGAGHADVDIFAWHIAGGVFVIDSASDPEFEGPSPIPSTPGHYSDHPAPGVAVEIQVTKIPNR
jgi:hypothetical protein